MNYQNASMKHHLKILGRSDFGYAQSPLSFSISKKGKSVVERSQNEGRDLGYALTPET